MRIVKQRLLEMIPGLSVFLDVDDLEDISGGKIVELPSPCSPLLLKSWIA